MSKTKGVLDSAPNPTTELDSWKRWKMHTIKNYSTFPIIFLSAVVVPIGLVCFIGYRIGNCPDLIWPGQYPQWDKWEHKQGTLKKIPKEILMQEHPRPRFEYKPPELHSNMAKLRRMFFSGNKS